MLHDEFTAVNLADKKDSSGWFTAVNLFPTRKEAALADLARNRVLQLPVTREGHHHQKGLERASLDSPVETLTPAAFSETRRSVNRRR